MDDRSFAAADTPSPVPTTRWDVEKSNSRALSRRRLSLLQIQRRGVAAGDEGAAGAALGCGAASEERGPGHAVRTAHRWRRRHSCPCANSAGVAALARLRHHDAHFLALLLAVALLAPPALARAQPAQAHQWLFTGPEGSYAGQAVESTDGSHVFLLGHPAAAMRASGRRNRAANGSGSGLAAHIRAGRSKVRQRASSKAIRTANLQAAPSGAAFFVSALWGGRARRGPD